MTNSITKYRYSSHQRILLLMCWIVYVSTYIVRLNYSAVMPEMIASSGFNKLELASIGSAFFITYGVSQIFNGFLGDKLPPEWMVFAGLTMAALSNIVMFLASSSLGAMITVWAVNGFAQSMIWSPLLKIGGEYFEPGNKERFGLHMSTTVPAGTLIAYLIAMLFIKFLPWRYVFLGCGLIVLCIAVGWITFSKLILSKYEKSNDVLVKPIEDIANDTREIKNINIGKMCLITVLVCLFPIAIHGALKDGITQFVPTFIVDNFDVATSFSLMVTMLLPIVNVTGAFIAKWVNKYIRNEFLVALIFFSISLVAILLLYFFKDVHVALTIVLLALVTNSMFAINVMMISFIPLKFAKYGKTSTMSGILNATAYIGCSISMMVTGGILDSASWNGVYGLWLGLAGTAIVVCLAMFTIWGRMKEKI